MTAVRHCLAMTLGVVALAVLLLALGAPSALVLAVAPVAVCLLMVGLMAREDDVEAGLLRFESSQGRRSGDPGQSRATHR